MKMYTDLEQSKKLAEILPLESADMFIADVFLKEEQTHSYNFHVLTTWGHKNFDELKERENMFVQFIPCWSLAALIELMPSEIKGHDLAMYKSYCYNDKGFAYSVYYEGEFIDYEQSILFSTFSMEFIDACYEMIIKLHEQKLL